MNEARRKIGIALLVIVILWLVSFSLSNLLKFEETSVSNKIAIIPITGFLAGEETESLLGETGASSRTIASFIEQADKDPSVNGIILEINSGGGTVLAGKEIAEAVKKTQKPTVALIREVGASGAYWVASAADKIVADEMSITGSIGVTSSYLEFSGLMEKYGVGYEELKSGQYKEAGSPFRELTPEERKMLQEKIDKIQAYFLKEIKENRNLSEETMKEVGKAGIYLGMEAYEINLVDYLGDREVAIKITKELAGIKEAKLVRYEERKGLIDLIGRLSAESYYNIGRGIGAGIIDRSKTENTLEIIS
ncbi:MAG: signal peptide peptidase SppA [archaeon]